MARKMKDSGIEWIGEIPEGWEVVQLKRFAEVHNGREIDVEVDSTDSSAVGVYGSGGVFKYTNRAQHSGKAVLFGRKGTLGKPLYVEGQLWAVDTMYFLTYSNRLLEKFSYYQFLAFNWAPYITHTAIPSVVASEIVACYFPIPPLEEQAKIADYLDNGCASLDAMLSKTRSSIEEYKKLKQAVITQAVTKGVRGEREMKKCNIGWVKELPSDWDTIPSKFLFKNSDTKKLNGDEQLTASQQHGIITQKYYTELTGSKVVLANKGLDDWKHVEPFDFIISLRSFQGGLEMSETTGCITWHYIVLKPCHQIYSYYYKWLFKSEIYIRALQRTCNFIRDGQDLRYSNFVQVPLFEPPLEEQKEIADYLNAKCTEIDGLIAKKEQLVKQLESYKKSLIYEVVTGKREV